VPKGVKGWEKGKSGNPNGRPRKNRCIPDLLRRIGDEEIDTKGGRISKLEAVLRKTYQLAFDGERWAVEFIADRTEGKAIQSIRQEVDASVDLTRRVVHARVGDGSPNT